MQSARRGERAHHQGSENQLSSSFPTKSSSRNNREVVVRRRSRRNKSVTFDVETYRRVNYFSYVHKYYNTSDVWYSRSDLQKIKRKNYKIAHKMKHGLFVEGKDHDTGRGLEKVENLQRHRIRQRAISAVITEQRRQFVMGIRSPRTIASIYRINGAAQCQNAASETGLQDFEDCCAPLQRNDKGVAVRDNR